MSSSLTSGARADRSTHGRICVVLCIQTIKHALVATLSIADVQALSVAPSPALAGAAGGSPAMMRRSRSATAR